jgi:hypothetical protein
LSDSIISAKKTPNSHWKFVRLRKYKQVSGWYAIPLYFKDSVRYAGFRFSQKWGYSSFVIDDLYLGSETDKGCTIELESTVETCNLLTCTRGRQIALDSGGLSCAVRNEINTLIESMDQYSFKEIFIDCVGDTNTLDSLSIGEKVAFNAMYFIRDSNAICVDKWNVQGTNDRTPRTNIIASPRLIIRFTYRNKLTSPYSPTKVPRR